MSWIVVDPRYATVTGVKVARVSVPYFPDEIDYEKILDDAFGGEESREWCEKIGVVILATGVGYSELERVMNGPVDVTAAAVREETTKLVLERQAVVMKWVRTQ